MTDVAAQEAKLVGLIAAASPGPWIQVFESEYDSGEETKYPIILAAPGTAYGGHRLQIIGNFRDEDDIALADARLAALAPGLAVALDLASALRSVPHSCARLASEPARCGICRAFARWDELLGRL